MLTKLFDYLKACRKNKEQNNVNKILVQFLMFLKNTH